MNTTNRTEVRRRPDWLPRLREALGSERRTTLSYGRHDCALVLAHVADAMTGSGFEAELRARYRDARGAVRLLRDAGGLEAAITERLGPPVAGHAARRGDGCLIERHCVGICVGDFVAVLTPRGIGYVPLGRTLKHWRIG